MKRITSADIFGRKFKFNFGGKTSTSRTALGGLLTLLVVVLIAPVLFIFTGRVIDKTHPIVSTNTILSNRSTSYQLREGDIFIGFITFNGAVFPHFEESKRCFNIKAERYTLYKDDNNEEREMRSTFPIISCTNSTQNYTSEIDKIVDAAGASALPRINASICGDLNRYHQWYIGGSITELPYTKMVYRVYPCSLEDKTRCIDINTLSQTQLVFVTHYKSMNFSHFLDPVVGGLDSDLTAIFSLNTQAKFTIWFKKNQIYDNSDTTLRNEAKFSFFNIDKITSTTGTRDLSTHCTEIAIEDGLCMPYITFEIRLSNRETLIQRKYYRVFDLVSDVGGMLDLLFIVILAVYVFYRSRKYKEWVVSEYSSNSSPAAEKEPKEGNLKREEGKSKREASSKGLLSLEDKKIQEDKFNSFSWINQQLDVVRFIDFSQKSYLLTQVLLQKNFFEPFRAFVYFRLKTTPRRKIPSFLSQKYRGNQSSQDKAVKKPPPPREPENEGIEKNLYKFYE